MTREAPAVLPTSDPSAGAGLGRDAFAGLASAVVLLAVHGSYGVIALAPLGPAHAATGFLMGVLSAVLANGVTAAAGDRGPMLSGPSAAIALLVQPLIGALMAHPALQAAGGGPPSAALVLALVGLGIALAGLMQLAVGAFRLGLVVRFVPFRCTPASWPAWPCSSCWPWCRMPWVSPRARVAWTGRKRWGQRELWTAALAVAVPLLQFAGALALTPC